MSWLLAAALLAAPPPPAGPERFLQVKEWTCTWTTNGEYVPQGDWTRHQQGNGSIDLKAEEGAIVGGSGMWTGDQGRAAGTVRGTREGGGHQGSGTSASRGSLQIDTQEGNRTYNFAASATDQIPGTWWAVDAYTGKRTSGTSDYQIIGSGVFAPLPASGLALTGTKVERTAERTFTKTWSCTPKGTEEYELILEPADAGYDKWLPLANLTHPELPGAFLSFKATFQKRGGGRPQQAPEKIRFNLVDTSREKGIALNYPKTAPSEAVDVRFPDEQGDAVRDADGQILEVDPSNDGKLEWTVMVASYDFGAFSRLRATAVMAGGVEVIGTFNPTGAEFATIPRDVDGGSNHVADFWEKKMGLAPGGAPDSDDDPVPSGQKDQGDGIPLFEEYRGFVRLKGMTDEKMHERTNPRVKTLFVIDEDKQWTVADWADAAVMESFRLDSTLVSIGTPIWTGKRNATNFLRGYAKGTDYDFAVRLVTSPDTSVANPLGTTETGTGDQEFVNLHGPRDVEKVVIFTGRLQGFVDGLPARMERWLANPSSGPGSFVGSPAREALVRSAIERLRQRPAIRASLLEALRRKVVVHEVGHACGMDHHGVVTTDVNLTDSDLSDWGERTCPARYFSGGDFVDIMIFDVLFPRDGMLLENGKFCSAGTCWPVLNVKDW